MKYLNLAVVVLLTAIALPAYAASPKPSGFLQDYGHLVEGEYLEAVWVDVAALRRSKAPRILLGEISSERLKDHKHVSVEDCVDWLKRAIHEGIIITSDEEAQYRLDLALTHMDPGSAAKRLLAGEFGAGHAQLQIEGKVVDLKTGVVVVRFAERRRSSGKIGLDDLGGHGDVHIIEHLVNLISSDIDNELLASFLAR